MTDPFAISELVTKQRFATIIGRSRDSVTNLINAGMPVARKALRRGVPTQIDTVAALDWFIRREAGLLKADENTSAFDAAKAREKEAQAGLRQLQLQEQREQLIPLEDVRAEMRNILGEVRERLLMVSNRRLAETLAAMDNPADVERAVSAEIDAALTELSNGFANAC